MEGIRHADFVRAAHVPADLLRDGRPQVAFVGRSNVGKSSLLNRLLGKKGLARISSTPGRTQSINYFSLDDRFYFVDLPGYGYAKTSKRRRNEWAELMDKYFDESADRVTVVMLVDGKIAGTRLDSEAFAYLEGKGIDPIVVATKIDKVPRGSRPRAVTALRDRLGLPKDRAVVEFSATTGEGVKQLWRVIDSRLGG